MAEKKTRLTKVEKFYIENNMETMSVEDLSKDIRCGKTLVQKQIDLLKSKNHQKQITMPAKAEDIVSSSMPKAGDFMIRNKRYGVTVMTRQSAEISDENRKNVKKTNTSREYIHKTKQL